MFKAKLTNILCYPIAILLLTGGLVGYVLAQQPQSAKVEIGSRTAKDGFKNETEIAAKFNGWRTDAEAKIWLAAMGYRENDVLSVLALKPHGEKADIVVKVTTKAAVRSEGISIKLVSSENGFNQIDKRWLATYAKMWKMPPEVVSGLKLFVGESKPPRVTRLSDRMFLDELSAVDRRRILEFFAANKDRIVSDLFEGDGNYRAGWIMVAQKSAEKPRWVLRRIDYAIRYFSEGDVAITPRGNLKIGRITMQRKGGDGGRETAKMLQFKINPALLFDGK